MATTLEPAARSARGAPAPGERIALWDNARLLLILLVVFGHLIEGLREDAGIRTLYDVVYSFHMPGFLLVSGWFARADRLDAKSLAGTARLLVTWLAAELLWAGGRALIGQEAFPGTFLVVPSWTFWFLVALFSMRLLLPYVALVRFPLVAAVAVALVAGLSTEIGTPYSVSRTLALLPLFLLGWWLRRAGVGEAAWFRAPSTRVRVAAAVGAAAVVVGVLLLRLLPGYSDQLLFWRRGYPAMGLDALSGPVLRLTFLVVAAALTVALLLLVPRRRFRFSVLGRNTLPIYLLHAPIVFAMRRNDADEAIGDLPGAVLIMLVLAIAMTAVLGSPPVARLLRPITEPDLLFRRPADR